jgi:hypothetical protein
MRPFRVLDGFMKIGITASEGMAGTTGLEPAASAVTGQRSNQLNYVPTRENQRTTELPVFMRLCAI